MSLKIALPDKPYSLVTFETYVLKTIAQVVTERFTQPFDDSVTQKKTLLGHQKLLGES